MADSGQEGNLMKVSVYRDEEGAMSVLVQASPGKGRPPVLVHGVTADNVKEAVGPLIDEMRKPRVRP